MQYYTLGISQADNERDYDKASISFNKAIDLNNNIAEAHINQYSFSSPQKQGSYNFFRAGILIIYVCNIKYW